MELDILLYFFRFKRIVDSTKFSLQIGYLFFLYITGKPKNVVQTTISGVCGAK